MNAAVIGASSESIYAIKKAQDLGLKVTALDGDKNAPGLRYADESFVVDIRDNDKVAAVLDARVPDVILPVPIGRYLISTGAMNDRYGLKGVRFKSADLCTDKYAFHKCLYDKGLRNTELTLFSAGSDTVDEAALTFPLVAKPRYGSGSRGVEIFSDITAFKIDFLSLAPFDEDYILENCIPGREYGVDGIYVDGSFDLILLREKDITPPPYRQCIAYYSIPGTSDFSKKVSDLVQAAGNALGLRDCVMHADIIRTNDDVPFIIELSPRPSGHNLHNLFTPLAGGVDEVETFIRSALGMEYKLTPSVREAMMIGYFNMEGLVRSVPDEYYLRSKYPIAEYSCSLVKGDELRTVTDGHSLMGRGFYILKASGREELENLSKALKAEFEVA